MLTSRLGTLGIEQFVGGNGDDVDNGDHNVDDDDGNNDDNNYIMINENTYDNGNNFFQCYFSEEHIASPEAITV